MPSPDKNLNQEHIVSRLPPIRISFSLPEAYPSDEPPVVKLSTTPPWLPIPIQLNLEATASSLWEDYGHGQVLFAYTSHVQEAAETVFGLDHLEVSPEIILPLVDFDIATERAAFENGSYECGVCLDPKKGTDCYRMDNCAHVFCKACLQEGYSNAIVLGNVNEVTCMDPDCGKEGLDAKARRGAARRLLTPRELLNLGLPQAAVQRWVDLIRKKKLESDRSTVWCPLVKHCGGAAKGNKYPRPDVPLEQIDISIWDSSTSSNRQDELLLQEYRTVEDSSMDPTGNTFDLHQSLQPRESSELVKGKELTQEEKLKPQDRLVICEDCNYSFCRVCFKTWHGDLIWCYEERNEKEISEEEQKSLDAIAMTTSPCPKCNIPVSKIDACNHMECWECETHFCYLCSEKLERISPYEHFNTPGTPCYQKLWVLSDGGSEETVEFRGVRGAEINARRQEEEERRRNAAEEQRRRRAEFERRLGSVVKKS
jgi:E3 ubiquitin-protein ligase RNF14